MTSNYIYIIILILLLLLHREHHPRLTCRWTLSSTQLGTSSNPLTPRHQGRSHSSLTTQTNTCRFTNTSTCTDSSFYTSSHCRRYLTAHCMDLIQQPSSENSAELIRSASTYLTDTMQWGKCQDACTHVHGDDVNHIITVWLHIMQRTVLLSKFSLSNACIVTK